MGLKWGLGLGTRLLTRFNSRSDPGSVMELLQAALSMDKLASLIKSEYHSDREALEELQNKLEGQFRVQSSKLIEQLLVLRGTIFHEFIYVTLKFLLTHPHTHTHTHSHYTEAYKTLQGCSEQKESFTKQISETEEKVKTKRKHLEDLREELKVLGKSLLLAALVAIQSEKV